MGGARESGFVFFKCSRIFPITSGSVIKGNHPELAAAVWTNERVGQVDAPDEMSPPFPQCGPLLWREGGVDWFWRRAFVRESGQSQFVLGSIRPGFRGVDAEAMDVVFAGLGNRPLWGCFEAIRCCVGCYEGLLVARSV